MSSPTLLSPVREVWRYWVGIFVPPTAWGARLLAGWAVAEDACASAYNTTAAYLSVQTALIAVTGGATVWSGLVGYRVWRQHGSVREGLDPADARPFLGLSGVISAAIFLALILLEGSAVYVVPC